MFLRFYACFVSLRLFFFTFQNMLLLFFLLSGCGILSKENFCEGILLMGGPGTGEGRNLCRHLINGWSRYWGKGGICSSLVRSGFQ